MTARKILFLMFLMFSSVVDAAEYVKEATLSWVQFESPTRPVNSAGEHRDFILFATGPGWSAYGGGGGPACTDAGAVLPLNNTTMRAVALTAIASKATVQVIADNTLTVGSYCQVTVLSIKGN
jgi:hypothetical protein